MADARGSWRCTSCNHILIDGVGSKWRIGVNHRLRSPLEIYRLQLLLVVLARPSLPRSVHLSRRQHWSRSGDSNGQAVLAILQVSKTALGRVLVCHLQSDSVSFPECDPAFVRSVPCSLLNPSPLDCSTSHRNDEYDCCQKKNGFLGFHHFGGSVNNEWYQ